MKDKYVFYDVDGERFSVRESEMSEFEKDFPNAIINMSVDGENFPVKLSEREDFLKDFGEGASYTNFDEQKDEGVTAKNPKKDSLNNILTSVNDSLMRAQLGANKTFADQQIEKVTAPAPEIDKDMANLVVESHRGNKARVDEYLAEQDKTGYDYDPTKMGGSIPMPAMGLAHNMYQQSKKAQKTKGQNYTDALIAQRLQGKVEDKVEQYLDPSKTFVTGAIEGVKDTAFDLDTWDSGMAAEDAARIYAISKKLDKGGELSEGEDMIIEALVDDLASDMYLAAGFGRGYKAGQVTGESLPFMIETMLNPASKFGESITKKFGKEVFKRVSRKLGAKAARAAVHSTRVLSDIAGASMMSATTSQARVAEDALNRLRGQVDFEINEDGTLGFKGFVDGEDSALKAYAKAYGANTIEHFSEMVGNYFAPMGEMAKEDTAALANKIGLKKVGELLTEMTPNGFGSLVNDFAEQTQWHGMIGEFAEEMVSGAMNALVVGDQSLRKYDKDGNLNENYLFDKENMIDTFLGVAILGGVMSTAKTFGYTTPETKYNREISRARKALEGQLTEDEIKQLEAFAANPMGAEYANLTPFFDKNRKQETKEAVAKYMSAVMEKQGYLIARDADLSGTQQGMNEMQNAWQLGSSMSETDLYDVDEAEAQAKQALLETGMFDVAEGATESFLPQDVLGYSSYDLFRLSERKDWDFTEDQRQALKNLAIVKNAKEGLNNRLNSIVNAAIARESTIANESANNGALTIGRHNDKTVFIRGNVAVANGSIEKPADVNGYPVEIVDFQTGETSLVDSSELSSVGTISAEIWNTNRGQVISDSYNARWEQWRNTKSAKSKLAEIQNFVGEKVYIKTANNDMAEVEIQQILPNGEVLIKGKKGDLGGQSTIRVDVDSFYDSMSRDANGNPIFNQSEFRSQTQGIADAQNRMYVQGQKARDARKPNQPTQTPATEQEVPQAETPQEQTPEPEVPQTPVGPTEPADFRDFADTIMVNGKRIKIDEVTAQDDVSDSITYRYTDENGVQRTGNMTIGAFAEAVTLARQQTNVPAPEPAPEPVEMVGETPVPATEAPAPTETPVPSEQPAPINWDDLLDNNPESYFTEMQSKHGEKTEKRLNAVIAAMQNQLDALNKAKPQTQDEIFENEERKELLQERIDKLNGMVARLTAPAVPEAPAETAPVAETPAEPTETPTPANEVPAEEVEEPTPTPATEPTPTPESVSETPEAPTASEPQPMPSPTPAQSEPVSKGGAISRLISEAKRQVAKLAAKAKIKDFILEDDVRPIMGGILRKDGYEYASDSHILAKIKAQYPAEQEGKVYSANTGQELTGRFPNADMVISSAEGINTEIDANVDDILATAQAAEELKKGLDKNKKIYIRIGQSVFDSSYLLKAARMAKQQGLTTISQHPTEQRAMLFAGENGVVLIMPMSGRTISSDIIDSSTGEAVFDELTPLSVKTPATLKGIEIVRTTLEAVLPNLSEAAIERLKDSGIIQLVDGKVFYNFLRSDIVNAKNKAKDPNTFNALEDIEKNGLEIPLSTSEIAKIFPENTGNPPVNSVPLENEPNGEDNGTEGTGASVRTNVRRRTNRGVRGATNGEGQGSDTGNSEEEGPKSQSKNNKGKELVEDKYPVRKGNATGQLLVDTFGLDSVTIPDTQKKILNTIYDFMMEMSKTLGISPKTIGQGGWLNVRNRPTSRKAIASHEITINTWTGEITDVSLRFKYSRLSSVAHEWWHSLDRALSYFETGKKADTATSISESAFTGRKETWDAVQAIMKALNDSGYTDRIRNLVKGETPKTQAYFLSPTEQAARAFDEYITMRFAEAGITIENYNNHRDVTQPTAEEMKVVTPAIENLFKVLQEKEGKKPGTSVLYHIGEMMAEDSTAKRLATDAVLTALDDSGIDVVRATDEQTQQMMDAMEDVAEMQKRTAPETASVQEEHHPTVVSSTDGTKVLKELDSAIQEYAEKSGASKTLLGDIAKALGANKHGSNSQYATFEAKSGKVFTIRLANHNAKVSNFDNHNEDEGISIVVASAPNNGIDNDGRAHIVEFYYDSIKLRKAEGKPLVEILKSIKQSLYSGEYKDNTGLAEIQEVNIPELMTVYHGSPSLFDEFDHSHMGEGEGAQAHGWGTYIAKSVDTAKSYASMGQVSYTGPKQSYGSYEYEVVEDIVSIMNHGNSFEEAIKIGRRYWSNLQWEPSHRAKRAFLETLTPEDFKLRNLYEVEIPEDNGENYLDESNPTKKQVEKLYDACQKEGLEYADVIAGETLLDNRPVGKKITSNLAKMLGSPQAASEFLSRAGFVGIKYDGRRDGECFVIFNESDAKITGRTEFYQTPNGTVYGWTDGKKIYLTKAGINPNTPIHEYTHLWAKAMMQKNPKGWNSIKQLLKNTPIWNEVMNDANYSNIHGNEDAVASEALSRISGTENAAKLEQMAQQMIDEAKGTMRKAEARGLIQNMKDALTKFWNWVGTNLFGIENFESVEQVTDRVLYDLLNKTDLGELSEGQVETQIVTDPKVIAELEASPKVIGYRNVVKHDDGSYSSPMAYWLQSTKDGAKSRVETPRFELGQWEGSEEHPELVDENGKVTLVKPNKKTVDNVAYDPYLHNRLEPVNLQFKDAWKRDDLVYVKTEVAETDIDSGYHADKALLPVGIHSWSNGDVMLSRYDKPVAEMDWEEVADAWVERLNGKGVHFDVVLPALRKPLIERGVEILPPHKGMGKDCNDAYKQWKDTDTLSREGDIVGFSESKDDFDTKVREAAKSVGIVREGLNSLLFSITKVDMHDFEGEHPADLARDWAKKNLVTTREDKENGTLPRMIDGTPYEISGNAISKYLSGKALKKSNDFDAHLSVLKELKNVIANSVDIEIHPDFLKEDDGSRTTNKYGENVLIHRLYGAISIDGRVYRVKTTMQEFRGNESNRPHSYEVTKIELLDSSMAAGESATVNGEQNPNNSISAANLLNGVEKSYDKGKYLLAESKDIVSYTDIQNAAVDYLAGPERNETIQRVVNEEAAKLGVSVTYSSREDMPKGLQNNKGYFNTKTGEIVICTENAASIADAIQTILHEAVAHKGLRQLMGDKFNEFINRVYDSLDSETKAKVDALAESKYNGNTAVAMEEYMASLAETENFAENSVWDIIKSAFERIINAILGRNDIKIGDNELRYILRASYNNMVNPRNMETIRGWAQDQMMREEYKINETTPELLSRTGIDDIAFTTAREAYETVTFRSFKEIFDSIRNATGIKGKAKAIKTGWLKIWNEIQMENQDAQQAVIAAIDAIQIETGNTPVADFENYLLAENQMQSRSSVEIEKFFDNYYSPIIDQINAVITQIMEARGLNPKNKKKRIEVYKEVRNYLIAKHGLERNKYYQSTKTRKMKQSEMQPELDQAEQDYNDKVNQINADTSLTDAERQLQLRDALDEYNAAIQEIKTREIPDIRDYAGLTSLFATNDLDDAEQQAQELVDNFENEVTTDELWAKINSATKKTLLHSYESGLLSRSQYEKIRDMFEFYIPLRGFDETTAEDVYDYARFDGNNFQPAVYTAKGRTSLAFDPIAVIMNMAQSEIIQGNKNRVKQTLYHYVGNRPNSLMSIRDCWYVKDAATGNFIEAYPDIDNGETWEAFENKMEALAQNGDAIKRKKGLDIGYRFQKPANKDEHYIHVVINGVEHAIVVDGNPRAAEGVNGFKDNSKDLINKVKKINRYSSQLYTNYNYKFGGKNFIRDFIWAQTVMFIKENPAYMIRFAGNWFANNPITIGAMMRKYKKGTLDLSKENHRMFKELVENGGQTGYVFIDALEKQKARIDAAVARMSKIGNKNTNPVIKAQLLLDVIQYVNESIELAARFGTYITSRNTKDRSGQVRSITQSINDAKGITTNFNRKGAQSGRGLIGGLANFMGAWNYFYNAGVQGVQLIKQLNDKHPIRAKFAIGGWVGLGFAMPFIVDLFKGDDDEEDIYWNIPEYERKNNICFPFGKGKVTMTIPLSPTLRDLFACGVTLSDAMFNKSVDKDATILSMECANLLAKGFIPANPAEGLSVGLTPAENLIMFGTPDVFDPIAEVVINKDYKGTPIENRTSYNEGAPHYTKVVGKDNWKEKVGEKIYKSDNLNSSRNWNLSAWEHVIKGGSGGIGVLIKDVANVVEWVTEWEAPERLNDVPVARTFVSSNAMDDEKFVNNIYWDMDEVYKKKTKVMSTVYKLTPTEAFKNEEGKGDANLVKVYEAKSYPFLKRYYELNKDITKKHDDIQKMPTETEDEKNEKAVAEQELFNMRRDLVYELLKYEIE